MLCIENSWISLPTEHYEIGRPATSPGWDVDIDAGTGRTDRTVRAGINWAAGAAAAADYKAAAAAATSDDGSAATAAAAADERNDERDDERNFNRWRTIIRIKTRIWIRTRIRDLDDSSVMLLRTEK